MVPLIACVLAMAADPAPVAGTVAADPGAVARREPGKAAFDILPDAAPVRAGDFLLPLPGAMIRSPAGGVVLTSRADFDGKSPFPILETAVTLNAAAANVELDITLERGRIDIENRKAAGPAAVNIRFRDHAWAVKLDEPGTRVAVEIYGRWPAGTPFKRKPTPGHVPTSSVLVLVLKGAVEIGDGATSTRLTAPPGPGMARWTSTDPGGPTAVRLDKLPAWADAAENAVGKTAVEKYRKLRAENPATAIDIMLASNDLADQRVALVAMGATDDLERLAKAISATKSVEVWDFGMGVVRHWVGRGPGQDEAFFAFLTGVRGYTPAAAGTLIRLLHGFSDADARRPETFEVLIEYLLHDKPAVRNLAAWHLVRLAPAGKAIPFRPDASKADADAVYAKWKALIPPGKLPPAAKE